MKKTDLAYVAGIIDGEGHIGLHCRNDRKLRYRLRVSVSNTNEWLIQWLHFNFEGYVYEVIMKNPKWKKQWKWSLSSNMAMEFLKLVYPYLRIKKPQAEIAIEFQSQRRGSGHHLTDEQRAVAEAHRLLMVKTNQRGNVP